MSAENIQFTPRPQHRGKPTDFPNMASRRAAAPGDLATDQVDTSPCECVGVNSEEIRIEDG